MDHQPAIPYQKCHISQRENDSKLVLTLGGDIFRRFKLEHLEEMPYRDHLRVPQCSPAQFEPASAKQTEEFQVGAKANGLQWAAHIRRRVLYPEIHINKIVNKLSLISA